jgi:chromosomal replication initiator protein
MNIEQVVENTRRSVSKIRSIRESVKIADLAEVADAEYPKIKHIKQIVSDFYGVPVSDIDSSRRKAMMVRARFVAIYLSYRLTPNSTPTIGRLFGNKDHTCVIYAHEQISQRIVDDKRLAADIEHLKAQILAA